MSNNAGGLMRWPVKLLMPLGFALMTLQGVSEIDQACRRAPGRYELRHEIREAPAMIPLDMMAPLMFGALVVFMLIGYPVAFSLAAVGLFFAVIAIEQGFFPIALLQALPERVFGIMSNDLLLAIPFFTFMGAILERCGLAEDLLEGVGQLFGPVRGGLAYAVILVGAMLGAITGTVAASVIAMGMIALPVMIRYDYDMRLATGVIAASGTITQLIPPSLVLIVLADQLGRSRRRHVSRAPSARASSRCCCSAPLSSWSASSSRSTCRRCRRRRARCRGWALGRKCLWGMVPSLVLIFLVLGTILLGLATPTEGGAMGAVGAMILAALHRRLTWTLLRQGMDTTMRITAMVVFILIGSTRLQPGLPRRRRRPSGSSIC